MPGRSPARSRMLQHSAACGTGAHIMSSKAFRCAIAGVGESVPRTCPAIAQVQRSAPMPAHLELPTHPLAYAQARPLYLVRADAGVVASRRCSRNAPTAAGEHDPRPGGMPAAICLQCGYEALLKQGFGGDFQRWSAGDTRAAGHGAQRTIRALRTRSGAPLLGPLASDSFEDHGDALSAHRCTSCTAHSVRRSFAAGSPPWWPDARPMAPSG